MGRPKKDARRDQQLNLSLTYTELDIVRSRAAKAGMPVPDYSRERLLSDRRTNARPVLDIPLIAPLLYEQLKRLGNNLNQIARSLNTRQEPVPGILLQLLAEIRELITKGSHHDR
jgi:hypothetical protein